MYAENETTVRNILSQEQCSSPSVNLQRTSDASDFDHARRHVHKRRIVRTEALARAGVDIEEQGIAILANKQSNVIGPRRSVNLQT
jgi:hypothetical protein